MSLQSTIRSRGDATGLSAASLSRRSALQGSAAAIVLAAGVTAARPSSVPDVALIDLAGHIEVLVSRERDAWICRATAEDAVFVTSPPIPVRREVADPFDAGANMSLPDRLSLYAGPNTYRTDLAAAEAEHRAAVVGHTRIIQAIEKQHGLARLQRQTDRLAEQILAASESLGEMTAVGPVGLAAKARALLAVVDKDGLSRSAEIERHDALLCLVLNDAVRLGAGRLA